MVSLSYLLLAYIMIITVSSNQEFIKEHASWCEQMAQQHPDCKSLISDANYQLLLDDVENDNQEIRNFRCCAAKYTELMKNGKININVIMEELQKNSKVDRSQLMAINLGIKICKNQAETAFNEADVAATFFNCILAQAKESSTTM